MVLALKNPGRNVRTNGLPRTEKQHPKKIWGVTFFHGDSVGTRTGLQLDTVTKSGMLWPGKGLRQKPDAKGETNV